MNRIFAATVFASACALLPPAHAAVSVTFTEPDKFSDIGISRAERQDNLRALERHFETLAKRYLPPEQDLSIEVTDVELAGEQRRSFSNPELRVVRHIDWPRMSLRYTLKSGEKVLAQGEEQLSDMAFDSHIGVNYASVQPLPYERRMLEDWFKAKFGRIQ